MNVQLKNGVVRDVKIKNKKDQEHVEIQCSPSLKMYAVADGVKYHDRELSYSKRFEAKACKIGRQQVINQK